MQTLEEELFSTVNFGNHSPRFFLIHHSGEADHYSSEADQLNYKTNCFCYRDLEERMTDEKKCHRSGHCMRTEPENIEVLSRDKAIVEAFKKVGCWKFCKKLQGGHTQVTKEFALHFDGLKTKVGMLDM